MKARTGQAHQRGVALVVALLFLLVVTIISVVAASNSALGLKMAANMQDSYASFQSAEAGVIGVLALAETDQDPFTGGDVPAPFAGFDAAEHPLRNVFGGPASVDAEVFLTNSRMACPRGGEASSVGLFECDYYRVSSQHAVPRKARTSVQLGVVKTTIGSGVK